ncbi:MAG: Wzz/FepE/Etk N-terminal domain-containing protein [Pseudomonadota bacterium]
MATSLEMNRPQLLAIWRRRRLPMLIALAVVLLAAFVAALTWPPTYVSTGTILIEQQEVPLDLVRSTISSFADQRIQMINQRVMTFGQPAGHRAEVRPVREGTQAPRPREDPGPDAQ